MEFLGLWKSPFWGANANTRMMKPTNQHISMLDLLLSLKQEAGFFCIISTSAQRTRNALTTRTESAGGKKKKIIIVIMIIPRLIKFLLLRQYCITRNIVAVFRSAWHVADSMKGKKKSAKHTHTVKSNLQRVLYILCKTVKKENWEKKELDNECLGLQVCACAKRLSLLRERLRRHLPCH